MEALLIILILVVWIGIKLSISDLRNTFEKEYPVLSRGIHLYDSGSYSESLEFFQPYTAQDHPPITCYLFLARIHVKMGNFNQAYWHFTRVLNRENNHGVVFYERAQVLIRLEEFDLALLDLDKAIWFERGNSEYYFQRGLLRLQLKMKKSANEDFTKAKNMGHENANFYLLQPMLFSDIL